MSAEWVGRCDHLKAEDLDAYDDTAEDITFNRFKYYLGDEAFEELEKGLGYDEHLRLKDDWHISHTKGKWKGEWAICLMWSAYHHIWLITE